jgi:hypothetical protein
MSDKTYDYEKHIYSTTNIHIGKLNICEGKTQKIYVLDNINEFNYHDIIKFILINKYKYSTVDTVKFIISSKIIAFPNLKFEDLKNMEYGYIFYFTL